MVDEPILQMLTLVVVVITPLFLRMEVQHKQQFRFIPST